MYDFLGQQYTEAEFMRIHLVRKMLNILRLNLKHLDNILINNPSKDLPYHNSQHMLTVAINSFKGASYFSLSETEKQNLFLAALYHDWNHTGSNVKDSINIERAIRSLENNLFNEADREAIEQLIRSSEFPHKSPESIAEGILQDADMLQHFEPDGELFIKGIGEELQLVSTIETTVNFIRNNNFNTVWANNKINLWLSNFDTPIK